jgi:hypothetical protein
VLPVSRFAVTILEVVSIFIVLITGSFISGSFIVGVVPNIKLPDPDSSVIIAASSAEVVAPN